MIGPRARLNSLSSSSVQTWLQFGLGALLLFGIAAAIDFANMSTRAPLGGQLTSSVVFALLLVAGAGIGGTLVWLAMRAVQGKRVRDFRDSVLWSAYLIAGLVIVTRLMR